jgi:capsular exopolysaccharide synthesis family protein
LLPRAGRLFFKKEVLSFSGPLDQLQLPVDLNKKLPLAWRMSLSLVPRENLPAWPAAGTVKSGSLAEQFLILRRRWLTFVLALILVPASAALVLALAGPHYTATGIMLYDPVDAPPPGQVPDDLGAQIQGSVVTSQAAIITSLPAAREIVTSLNLDADPEFNTALDRHVWSAWLPARPPSPDAVAGAVRDALTVAVPPNSSLITVSFASQNAGLAAAGANLAMQLYLGTQRDTAYANLTGEEAWIAAHDAALQAQLDATEAALAKARAAAGIVSGEQVSIATETASRLAASLVDAKANLAMDEARLASAGAGDAAAANAAIAPNILPLRDEAAELAAQINSLAGEYGASYPDLVAGRAKLAAIDAALAQETGRELDSAKADLAADQAQVATLQGAVDAAKKTAQSQDAETAPIRALEQTEATQKTLLGSMAQQASQLAQQAALTKPISTILSAAAPPDESSGPKRGQILAAAGVLGACLGVLLVQLSEHLDTTLRSGGELRTQTGLACLALVPQIKNPMTAPLLSPFSLFAEQLRILRTALTQTPETRIVAITAARPDEGKTTLTVALARGLAASGSRVLAIDGDVRQPSFDAIFGAGGGAGLTDFLAGAAALDDIIMQDALSPLHVIGAGRQGQDALSLFLSKTLPALLAQLRERYDFVLIDVPPAFALAEAGVIARLADGALLCVRWGKTPSRVVQAAIVLLAEAHVKIFGAALTRVHAGRHKRSGFADAEMYQPRYGGYFRGE